MHICMLLLQASAVQAQNIREKVESISLWQEVTQQTLREQQVQLGKQTEEVSITFGLKQSIAL